MFNYKSLVRYLPSCMEGLDEGPLIYLLSICTNLGYELVLCNSFIKEVGLLTRAF